MVKHVTAHLNTFIHFELVFAFGDACSSIMRKTVCNHSYFKRAFPPSSSYISDKWERTDEVRRESGSVRLSESFQVEDNGLHRDPSSSGDRLGKCLIVLDCRGGRGGHGNPSPPVSSPSLLHHSAFSLVICITLSNQIVSHFFISLSRSTSIPIISASFCLYILFYFLLPRIY